MLFTTPETMRKLPGKFIVHLLTVLFEIMEEISQWLSDFPYWRRAFCNRSMDGVIRDAFPVCWKGSGDPTLPNGLVKWVARHVAHTIECHIDWLAVGTWMWWNTRATHLIRADIFSNLSEFWSAVEKDTLLIVHPIDRIRVPICLRKKSGYFLKRKNV